MKKSLNKNHLPATVLILLAGILAGFLIGRISFRTAPAAPPQTQEITQQYATATQSQQIKQAVAAQPQGTYLQPKVFETVEGVSAGGDPILGSSSAPVTVIEFTDYQCPYCRKHFQDTFDALKTQYIDTGKVKYVVRNFPLPEHPQALPAAEAAGCALEQGKFWEMHDLLFNGQDSWSYAGDPAGTFKQFAAQLGLDKGKFSDCLDKNIYADVIARDVADGELYKVAFTPTTFVDDKKIVGAQTFDTFKNVIEDELKLWRQKQKT